jgi:transposase, IS6 family
VGVLAAHNKLRRSKYLSKLVEQDIRFIKRQVKQGMGIFSFKTTWRTLQGYEVIDIRQLQMQGARKGDNPLQAPFIASVFGVAI